MYGDSAFVSLILHTWAVSFFGSIPRLFFISILSDIIADFLFNSTVLITLLLNAISLNIPFTFSFSPFTPA